MTSSSHTKVYKQLKSKPAKLGKFKKHNTPKERKTGRNLHKCVRCGRRRGIIGKYGLDVCRQCFREVALKLGFKKFN